MSNDEANVSRRDSEDTSECSNGARGTIRHGTVIVGDGYTDFEVYNQGVADYFFAFTEHSAREKVVNAVAAASDETAFLVESAVELDEILFREP